MTVPMHARALAWAMLTLTAALPAPAAAEASCEAATFVSLGDGYLYYLSSSGCYHKQGSTEYWRSGERVEYWVYDALSLNGVRRVAGVAFEETYVRFFDGTERTTHFTYVYADRATFHTGYEEADVGNAPSDCRIVAELDRGTSTGTRAKSPDLPVCLGHGVLL